MKTRITSQRIENSPTIHSAVGASRLPFRGTLACLILLGLGITARSTAAPMEREVTLSFHAGKIYELAFAVIKEGGQPKLQEYFGKVMPVAKDYQARPLGTFMIAEMTSKQPSLSLQPNLMGIFEWNSVEHFLRLHEDPRFLSVVGIRDSALSYLNNGNFFTVDQDIEITIRENHAYEFITAWIDPVSGNLDSELDAIDRMNYIRKKTNLVDLKRFVLSEATQHAVDAACQVPSDHNYFPKVLRLSEWKDMVTASKGKSSKGYNRYERYITIFAFPPKPGESS